jgi:hypothetical protein
MWALILRIANQNGGTTNVIEGFSSRGNAAAAGNAAQDQLTGGGRTVTYAVVEVS